MLLLTRALSLVPEPGRNVRYFYSEMLPTTNWSEVEISPAYSLGQAE